ncbi:MAG: hypothetical protein J6K41_06065 [Paraprevotella sp.]|nr:hypothetical protein [Paraprevotella sp.]
MDAMEITFQDLVDALIEKILPRIEQEVPDYGAFYPVLELFDNLDEGTQHVVGKYGLKVYKMPPDIVADPAKRYVEAVAYEPGGNYKATLIVGSGNKTDIIALLLSEDFPEKLNRAFGKLLDMLKD